MRLQWKLNAHWHFYFGSDSLLSLPQHRSLLISRNRAIRKLIGANGFLSQRNPLFSCILSFIFYLNNTVSKKNPCRAVKLAVNWSCIRFAHKMRCTRFFFFFTWTRVNILIFVKAFNDKSSHQFTEAFKRCAYMHNTAILWINQSKRKGSDVWKSEVCSKSKTPLEYKHFIHTFNPD